MKLPIEEALKTGKIVEGAICYTGDITSPNETKYTLDYYVKMAKELESLGCHSIAIKDMAGLLKPLAAKELISTLKQRTSCTITFAYTRFHGKWCKYCYDGGRSRRRYCRPGN